MISRKSTYHERVKAHIALNIIQWLEQFILQL